MRLEQLQYIVETAKQKSISKAAKNLYISQPSLSKAISQLETELGFFYFCPSAAGSHSHHQRRNYRCQSANNSKRN